MAFITNILNGPSVTGAYANGQPSGILTDGGNIKAGGVQTGDIWAVAGRFGGACASAGCGYWSWARSSNVTVITVPSGVSGITGINSGSPWNYNNPTGIIPTVTTGIAGRPFDGMNGGASNSANEIVGECSHWSKSPLYKHAVVSGWWSEYRGQFSFMTEDTETTPSGGLWNISNGTILSHCTGQNNDSQNEPGELVYNMGGIPTQTGYGPRGNY